MTLISASEKSDIVMSLLPRRAASSAASFERFSRSAPVKPGVPLATVERSTSSARGLFLTWIFRISSRPRMSGSPT